MHALPSLKALQAFEVAARTGSFVAAAAELSVSSAAISQLVRSLETQLERQLFHRVNRSIVLTEAGLEVLPRLSAVFRELHDISQQLAGMTPRSYLTVSVPPSMASGWLSARISTFIRQHGAHDISIRGENDPVDFERNMIDVRLSYGRFHYHTYETEALISDSVFPVCAPAFLREYGPFEQLEQLLTVPLIHTDWGPAAATFPSWQRWFEAASLTPEHQRFSGGLTANSSKVALDFAINGLGVALSQGLFAADAIAQGQLLRPLQQQLSLSQPYCLTIPQRSAPRPVVVAFRQWLIQQCRHTIEM